MWNILKWGGGVNKSAPIQNRRHLKAGKVWNVWFRIFAFVFLKWIDSINCINGPCLLYGGHILQFRNMFSIWNTVSTGTFDVNILQYTCVDQRWIQISILSFGAPHGECSQAASRRSQSWIPCIVKPQPYIVRYHYVYIVVLGYCEIIFPGDSSWTCAAISLIMGRTSVLCYKHKAELVNKQTENSPYTTKLLFDAGDCCMINSKQLASNG